MPVRRNYRGARKINDIVQKGADERFDRQVERFYSSTKWRNFRFLVFDKYGINCVNCPENFPTSLPQPATVVHHLIEVRADWNKRFDLDNVVPLCEACHNIAHPEKCGKREKPKPEYALTI